MMNLGIGLGVGDPTPMLASSVLGGATISAPAVFSPADVDGYFFHIDPSVSASITLDGSSKVQQIADLSGNLNHATQSTSGNRGVVQAAALNSMDVLFMASGKSITIPPEVLAACNTGEKQLTFFCLLKYTGTGTYVVTFDTATRHLSVFFDSVAHAISYVSVGASPGAPEFGTTAYDPVQWGLVCVEADGSNARFYVDGKGTAVKSQGTTFTEAISLGANPSSGGNLPIAYYAETLLFNTDIGTTDRQKIEGYLMWKWGLQAQLDPSHPYASAAP